MSVYLFLFLRVAGECYRCYYDIINRKRDPTTAELLAQRKER